jgi:hypothetical protein
MAIVEVKPIERQRWHGKTGKDSFSRPVSISTPVSVITGQYATGLTEEDRERLEKITGYDLSPEYNVGKPHSFWGQAVSKVKLEDKTNIFNTDLPINEIKVKMLKAHDLIANSLSDYEKGKFPNALFVIHDETEELAVRASKAAIKRNVILELSKLPNEQKAEIVQILKGESVRKQSENYIDLKIEDCIDEFGAEKVLNLIKRDSKRNTLHAQVLEALYKNVLRKDGTAVYYMDDQIGFDVESAVDYFADKKNQSLKAQILEKLV